MERSEARQGRATATAKAGAKATINSIAQARSPAGISIPTAPVVRETTASFFHDGAHDSNEVAAATVQSITDKITNRVMDSIKKGRRGRKKIPVMVV